MAATRCANAARAGDETVGVGAKGGIDGKFDPGATAGRQRQAGGLEFAAQQRGQVVRAPQIRVGTDDEGSAAEDQGPRSGYEHCAYLRSWGELWSVPIMPSPRRLPPAI